MKYDICIQPHSVNDLSVIYAEVEGKKYELLQIDRDSYICSGAIDNSDVIISTTGKVVCNLQIGKFSSLATNIYFLIGRNKNYHRVTMSASKLFDGVQTKNVCSHHEKGDVLIGNDVWVGANVSIMSGVIVHDGAVVAAGSHVIKDVPSYAIVGGNPAKILGYRFPEETIYKLKKIQWWNWSEEKIKENSQYFNDDIDTFCKKFYCEEDATKKLDCNEDIYFMMSDLETLCPVTAYVLEEFLNSFLNDNNKKLVINIIENNPLNEQLMDIVESIKEETIKCSVEISYMSMEQIQVFMNKVSYLITNRSSNTISLISMAEATGKEIKYISGVDIPVFS